MENVKVEEIKTKVCKVCGKEKPVSGFHSRGGGYYRTTCKVSTIIKNNKLENNDIWSIDEYYIVIDSLISKKVKNINEIELMLPNKTLKDIVIFLNKDINL